MLNETKTRNTYPSDLTDDQWAILEPLIPAEKTTDGGRPREVDMREVINAILYIYGSGCQWDMLPNDSLPKSTVYDYFAQWRNDGTWTQLDAACGCRFGRTQDARPRPAPFASTASR